MKWLLNKNLFLFYIGFTTYVSLEVIWKFWKYSSHWIMGCCGGITLVLLDKINDKISWDTDILLQGCVGSVLITGMEFIIGNLYLAGLLPKMWDYSNMWLNYKGIVCLPFSLLWIVLSIVAIFLADSINYYIYKELPVPYYKLFGKIIIRFKNHSGVYFCTDKDKID